MERPPHMSTPYDFPVQGLDGTPLDTGAWRGKVLLLVNTASACGFTGQLGGLERLHQRFHPQGLEVVGFPCNQFRAQEPLTDAQIGAFCQKNYGVSFVLAAKCEVNGPGAHPLWVYLKQHKPGVLGTRAIKWNFTKFLVNRRGEVVARFAPITPPERLAEAITRCLAETP